MKKLITILFLLTLGVKSYAFPYKVNTAAVKASEVGTQWTNFIWSMNAGSDQSFVFHTDQQGVTKVALRFGTTAGSTSYPLEWQSLDISLTSTGSIFQGYLLRTNLPPDRTYYAEFAGFIGTNLTSAGSILGRGRINIQSSLFTDSNYTTQIVYQSVMGRTNEVDPVYLADKTNILNSIATGDANWSTNPAVSTVQFNQNYADNVGGIDFDQSPASNAIAGRLQWNSDRATLKLGNNANIQNDIGQQLMLYAKSIETNQINKGEVVLVVGASGDNPTIKRASNASEELSARTIGVAAENIASNANGFVVTAGTIYNLNTSGYAQGQPLYLGDNGGFVTNLPVAPLHGVFIGTVERVHPNAGQVFIHIQNYQELDELSDVRIDGVTSGQYLVYNGSVWSNVSLDLSGYSTGTPLYAYTETDTIATNKLTNYYTIVQANALFATGSPLYSVSLSGYATGTPLYVQDTNFVPNSGGEISGELLFTGVSGGGMTLEPKASASADSKPIKFVDVNLFSQKTTNTLSGDYVTGRLKHNRLSTDNYIAYLSDVAAATSTLAPRVLLVEEYTNRAASALASSVWANADSTTNYQTRTGFISASNSLNTRITLLETATATTGTVASLQTNVSARLASNVWSNADSTTNYAQRNLYNQRIIDISNIVRNASYGSFTNKIKMEESASTFSSPSLAIEFGLRDATATEQTYSLRAETNRFVRRVGSTSYFIWDSNNDGSGSGLDSDLLDGNDTSYFRNFNNLTNVPAFASTQLLAEALSYTSRVAAIEPYTSRVVLVEGYTNRAALSLQSNVWSSADSTTNYASRVIFNASSNALNSRIVAVEGYTSRVVAVELYTNRAASALSSSVWAIADSTTNYQTRTGFIAASNAIDGRLDLLEGSVATTGTVALLQTNVSARLSSNVWALADSTTNYQSRVQFVASSNALSARINNISNIVRGAQYGSFTNNVLIDEGSVNLLGKYSKSLQFRGVDLDAVAKTSGIRYFPYGGVDYLYWDGAFNSEVLLLSNNTINAGVMTPVLDGYYEKVGIALTNNQTNVTLQGTFTGDGSGLSGVSASATNAVSTITLTSAVKDAVTFIGSGISQTGSTFNWNGYLTTASAASTYLTSTGAAAIYLTSTSASATYLSITSAAAIYLPLNGGTLTNSLTISKSSTAATMLTITNNASIPIGLRADLGGGGTYLDFNQTGTGAGDEYTFSDTIANFHGNKITNALIGSENLTNLSVIAGSGLGVTGNQLVVTNGGAVTFEELTGNRFSLGNSSVTNISVTATGAFAAVVVDSDATNSIGVRSYGASQHGFVDRGTASISNSAYGASQRGYIFGTAHIGQLAAGSYQVGALAGTNIIEISSIGSSQQGAFAGRAVIGAYAHGAMQIGSTDYGTIATNDAIGAIQMIGGFDDEFYTTTDTGRGSLLLGPGTQTNAYGILANGPIQTLSGFVGNASNLTNFPSSLLTVSAGNANYWRITTAPTGATASGSSGQLAVSGTNIYIYSPNALGIGTARWLRVTGDAAW